MEQICQREKLIKIKKNSGWTLKTCAYTKKMKMLSASMKKHTKPMMTVIRESNQENDTSLESRKLQDKIKPDSNINASWKKNSQPSSQVICIEKVFCSQIITTAPKVTVIAPRWHRWLLNCQGAPGFRSWTHLNWLPTRLTRSLSAPLVWHLYDIPY